MISLSVFPALALLQASNTNAIVSTIFMYGALFAIFYFVLLRPQRKQRKDHEELVRALKRGDEVVTAGGVIGEVVHIQSAGTKDGAPSMEDRITIKSAESRLIIERGRITRVIRETPSKLTNA
jgi:preprotein translocase subunit YajC